MENLRNIVFKLDQTPFNSIRIQVLKDNKPLSPFSPSVPSNIRYIMKQSMSRNDTSKLLVDLFDSYEAIDILVKYKQFYIKCQWVKGSKQSKRLNLSQDGELVFISDDTNSKGLYFFANIFCLDLKKGLLYQYEHDDYNLLTSFFDGIKRLKKTEVNKDMLNTCSLPIEDFNKFGNLLSSDLIYQRINFFSNGVQDIFSMESSLVCLVSYIDAYESVELKLCYKVADEYIPVPVKYIDEWLMQKHWIFNDASLKSKSILLAWLFYYVKANKSRRKRLLSHFLPKIIINEEVREKFIVELGLAFESEQLVENILISKKGWVKLKVDLLTIFCFYFSFAYFFVKNTYFGLDNCQLQVSKKFFHSCFLEFWDVLKDHNINVEYSHIHVEPLQSEVELLVNSTESTQQYVFDNELLKEQDIKTMKQNHWSVTQGNTVHLFTADLKKKIGSVLNYQDFRLFMNESSSERKNIRELIDYKYLEDKGVNIDFSADDRKMLEKLGKPSSLQVLELPKNIKKPPRNYQTFSLNWLYFLYSCQLGGILADDMGLGKTYQAILFLAYLYENKPSAQKHIPHLVVVPPSLLFNWEKEFESFYPDLTVQLFSLTNKIDKKVDVVLVTYEILRRNVDVFKKIKFDVMICDEAQLLKNKQSARSMAVSNLDRQFTLFLSGTPIENNYSEYHTLVNLTVRNLLGSNNKVSVLNKKNLDYILNRTRPFVLRRTKQSIELELPKKNEQTIFFNMTESQLISYNQYLNQARGELKSKNLTSNQSKLFVLNILMKLRQICLSPFLIDEGYDEPTPKYMFLRERLKTLNKEKHSVLVFSQFRRSLDLIEKICLEENLSHFRLDGKTSTAKRKRIIESFQSSDKPEVFIISLKAGGLGLNLVKASYVFHMDPWWNPAVEMQATDRTHRIGQTQSVFSFRLAMHNSIEEKILKMNDKKKMMFDLLLNNKSILGAKKNITIKELVDILSM